MTSAGVASGWSRPSSLDLGRERDRLGGAREHATAGRDQPFVVLPARAGYVEQALALGPGRGRIGVGIEKDVAVVEGRHELDRARQQHAVAEHVTRHVADAGDGHGLRLDVDVHLAEMALHCLPGTARGDAHGLMVVTLAATGGEGVAEPEAGLGRDGVGDVGKRRRALVGGDDQIGIIAVVPQVFSGGTTRSPSRLSVSWRRVRTKVL